MKDKILLEDRGSLLTENSVFLIMEVSDLSLPQDLVRTMKIEKESRVLAIVFKHRILEV